MRRNGRDIEDQDVERLLGELGQHTRPRDEGELRRMARSAAAEPRAPGPANSSGFSRPRWAHPLRWATVAVGVALLAGSSLGFGLGSSLTSSETARAAAVGTGFLPARGWTVVQSGTVDSLGATRAIAANVPLGAGDELHDMPYTTLRSLPERGVVIVATFTTRGDPGADFAYPVRTLPLGLESAAIVSPATDPLPFADSLTRYRLRAGVGGTNVDARLYFGAAQPTASALRAAELQLGRLAVAAERVTIFARPTVLGAPGSIATVFGSVDNGRAGETVTIQAKDCGSSFFRTAAETETHSGGGWSIQFSSGINTTVRAVWKDSSSTQVAIRQRANVFLDKQRSGRGLRVGVGGKRSFWRKKVDIQRRQGGSWKTVKSVVLTDSSTSSGSGSWTEAKFRLAVPNGTPVRAVLPLAEARPCYLPGVSRTVRT
jgi:hypothetical protein